MFKNLNVTKHPTSAFSRLLSCGPFDAQQFSMWITNNGDSPIVFKLMARSSGDPHSVDVPFRVCDAGVTSVEHSLMPGSSVSLHGGPTSQEWTVMIKSAAVSPGSVTGKVTHGSPNPSSLVVVDSRSDQQKVASRLLLPSTLFVAVAGVSRAWSDSEMLIVADNGEDAVVIENLMAGGSDLASDPALTVLDGFLISPEMSASTGLTVESSLVVVVSNTQMHGTPGTLFNAGSLSVVLTSTGYEVQQGGESLISTACDRLPGDAVALTVTGSTCQLVTKDIITPSAACDTVTGEVQLVFGGEGSSYGRLSAVFVGNDPAFAQTVISVLAGL